MDRLRQQTDLPWRSAITGGKERTYYSEIAGGITLAIVAIALVLGGLLL